MAGDAVRGWTGRDCGLSGRARDGRVLGEQIHGGVYAQPHALEREIMLAALLGFTRRPGLVVPAARFLMGR